MKIYRSIEEEVRDFVDMDHRWRNSDKGLIWCWERGRQMSTENPDLAVRARKGELMVLGWKGGVADGIKIKSKKGAFNYLAQWQGLRGEDLKIDTDLPTVKVCSSTSIEVTYSKDGFKEEE